MNNALSRPQVRVLGSVSLMLTSAILSFAALHATSAAALTVRESAALCAATSTQAGYGGSGGATGVGLLRTGTTVNALWDCAFIDQTSNANTLDHTEVIAVNVHTYDATSTGVITARLCIQEATAVGESCGTSASTSAASSGNATIVLDDAAERSEWSSASNTSDYAYINVSMNTAAGLDSRVYGYAANN